MQANYLNMTIIKEIAIGYSIGRRVDSLNTICKVQLKFLFTCEILIYPLHWTLTQGIIIDYVHD